MVNIAHFQKYWAAQGLAHQLTLGPQSPPPNLSAQSLVPVNELPMNFASQPVDHGYLKVLIIGKATIVKALSEGSAMCNRFFICVELDPNPVSHWNAVYHVKEKRLHSRQPWFVLFASQFLFLNNARTRQFADVDSAQRPVGTRERSAG
jgi:hypothetical protein